MGGRMMGDRVVIEERRFHVEEQWSQSHPGVPIGGIVPVIDKVAHDFAGAVDWLPGCCSNVDGRLRLSITENEVGLHEGGYIKLSAEPLENTVRITGGCYDSYFRPVTVCEKSLPFNGLKERALGEVLMETHDKLSKYYRTHVS